ncbi:hypothetical protein HDU91_006852 [Kappamyces sp. JEL0680]|nr:hypothetical protein HDU91_006852 [Kappamyces sp. JEL0680]
MLRGIEGCVAIRSAVAQRDNQEVKDAILEILLETRDGLLLFVAKRWMSLDLQELSPSLLEKSHSSTLSEARVHCVISLATRNMAASKPIDTANFDYSIKPQESFYHHVNGTWLKNTQIPEDKSSYNVFVELDDLSKKNLKEIFDGLVDEPEGNNIIAEMYLSGMDENAIEKAGLQPIQDILDRIAAIKTVADVVSVVAALHAEGLGSPLFGTGSSSDAKDSKNNALHGAQAGLGLPDRDYYFDDSKEKQIAAFKVYIATLLKLSGTAAEDAQASAEAVFEFEKKVADISLRLVDRRDPIKTYNKVTIAELKTLAPIDWDGYFKTMGIPECQSIILENTPYFSSLVKLMEGTELDTLKSYLRYYSISSAAPYLSSPFVNAHFEFKEKTVNGTKEQKPRWKRIIEFTSAELRDLVGQAYVKRFFDASAKVAAKDMVHFIIGAFEKRLKGLDWMQDATKELALLKLSKFRVKIGYPDKWIDYSSLSGKISRKSTFLTNIRKASAFNTKRELLEYKEPSDLDKWHMPPYMVNAYFHPIMNEIVFPAAILQPPFYYRPSPELPYGQAALNFGGIGGVIAHEITHGYDDQGRQFNHEGNLVDWWQPADGENFLSRSAKIIAQFGKFQLLGKNVDGKMTQGENIADLGGVAVSFAAFVEFMQNTGRDKLPQNGNFTQEQQFYISWAQVWKNVIRDDALLNRLVTDVHSPGEFRVDGVLMNLPDFHKAFDIKQGDRMCAPEEERGPEPNYENSVQGIEICHDPNPLELANGGRLSEFKIAYETWGKLNEAKDNVILLHTGLSASSHAKSHANNTKPGWWESFIGPGLALDTNKFHVICTNVLGGCYGSTGPSSVDPQTPNQERYATNFPILTIFDMARAQFRMLDQLGIQKLHASVGSSMAPHLRRLSLATAALFPDRVGRLVTISACAQSHPYSIALRYAQRQVLMNDPNWNKGFYYHGVLPHTGMKIATISYRSGPEWEERFGRVRKSPESTPAFCADYLIETYLDHQGERWCLTYDPNSLLYVSKAMDMFDMSYPLPTCTPDGLTMAAKQEQEPDLSALSKTEALVKGMSKIQMPTLVLGVQTDLLFPVWQQKEIADCLKKAGNKNVTYYELDAKYGHDSFLLLTNEVGGAVKGHLEMQ